jgi:hypothetical protein
LFKELDLAKQRGVVEQKRVDEARAKKRRKLEAIKEHGQSMHISPHISRGGSGKRKRRVKEMSFGRQPSVSLGWKRRRTAKELYGRRDHRLPSPYAHPVGAIARVAGPLLAVIPLGSAWIYSYAVFKGTVILDVITDEFEKFAAVAGWQARSICLTGGKLLKEVLWLVGTSVGDLVLAVKILILLYGAYVLWTFIQSVCTKTTTSREGDGMASPAAGALPAEP